MRGGIRLAVLALACAGGTAASQDADTSRIAPWRAAPSAGDRVWVATWVNTARAADVSAGPVWLGRGVTLATGAGTSGAWRRVSWALRPVAFWSQNAAYSPSRSVPAPPDFTNPWYVGYIDRPYRFGPDSYARLDAGESFVRVVGLGVGAGVSNEAQVWGPTRLRPLLLSGNGGGFPHAFLETARPVNVGIGRFEAKWIAGRITSSSYGPAHPGTTARLGVGLVGAFVPRGLDALQLGAARFFHLYDTPGVRDLTTATLPVSELLKNRIGNIEAGARQYNQLLSVFFRLAPANAGVEVYGELLKDDHSGDLRDLMVELDHITAYLIGLRRSYASAGRVRALTVEASNGEMSHLHRVRPQSPMYLHTKIVEGHTLNGMPLGSPELLGGGGLSVEWREATESGVWAATVAFVRAAQNMEAGTWNGLTSGYVSVALAREFQRANRRLETRASVEPGFGDMRGVNVGLSARVWRRAAR